MNKTVKNENAITLVALVVTIIVMLILISVTVTIALNGDLFGKTQEAAVGTQKEIEREELIEMIIPLINPNTGEVDVDALGQKILSSPNNYEEVEDKSTDVVAALRGKSGTIWLINIENGKVTELVEKWKERGLTSDNIVFDKKYIWSGTGLYSKLNTDGSWQNNIGEDLPSRLVDEAIEIGTLIIDSTHNNIFFTDDRNGRGTGWEYIDDNGVKKLNLYSGIWNANDIYNSIITSGTLVGTFVLEND